MLCLIMKQLFMKYVINFMRKKNEFPVTLLFIPVYYMSEVLMYLNGLFQASNINEAIYSAICSGQDDYVINTTIEELKKRKSQNQTSTHNLYCWNGI